jgi:1-acyl-sn-glycerol-3-phosphate acyltransferase
VLPLACVPRRREIRRRWSRALLGVLGVKLEAHAVRIAPGTLVVANHVSWLDVMVLNTLCPASFVAKAELRRWPLLGWLLERNGTLFLKRGFNRGLGRFNAQIARRLAAGEVVVVFPEGTTSDGAALRPFGSALFEAAVRRAHPVQAFALAYRDARGGRCAAAAYIDRQSLWESLHAIASVRTLVAGVQPAGLIETASLNRRQIAARAQRAVQERLAGGSSFAVPAKAGDSTAGTDGSGSNSGAIPSSTAPSWASAEAVSRV